METTIRKFPIGIQTFDKIISGKYLYIDKTGYVNDIADKYKYVFLNRPLGFGKSLLSSTLHCYFEGRKELFEFKVDGSAEDALKQIDDKGYMLPYKFEEGKNLVKVGVNISLQTRTVEKWIAK